jgi:GGDEF domain-containing protein
MLSATSSPALASLSLARADTPPAGETGCGCAWPPVLRIDGMNQIRWRLVSLLFWLTVFFNIERLDLDLGQIDTINLPSSVYLIGTVGAVLALMPMFQRRPMLLLIAGALACYVGSLLLTSEPVLGGVHTYLTLSAALMLVLTIYLAYSLGRSLSEFLSAVEEMTFSARGGQLHSGIEAQDLVQREMVFSRRSQRPLSLVLLQAEAESMNLMMHRLIQDIQRMMLQRYLLSTVSRVLSRHVRRTDLITEGPEPGQIVLLAPETTTQDAQALGDRLAQVTRDRLGVEASFSVVTFPEHALTYEELLNVAQSRLREQRVALPPAVEPEEQITRLAQQHAHEPLPPSSAEIADAADAAA